MDEIHFSTVHVFVALLLISVALTFFSLGKKYCNCASVEHRFIPRDEEDNDDSATKAFASLM